MVAISIAPGYSAAATERAVERAAPGTLALADPSEVARVDTNSRIINEAAIIITALALLLGAVVVVNTMAMAVIERRREFGVLAAVGWTPFRIARLLFGESVAVSLAGTLVGLAAGSLASVLLVHALAAAVFVSPSITLWVLARGVIVGFALGVLGSLFAVWQVIRVPMLEALAARVRSPAHDAPARPLAAAGRRATISLMHRPTRLAPIGVACLLALAGCGGGGGHASSGASKSPMWRRRTRSALRRGRRRRR